MYNQLKKMRQEEGFTLIELLIVIVILGVLAAIVVFSVTGVTDRGKANACKTDLATVNTAIEAYYAQKGSYPGSSDDLVVSAGNPNAFLHGPFPSDVTYTGGPTATASC